MALSALENDIISSNFKVNCKGHKHPLELYGQKYDNGGVIKGGASLSYFGGYKLS